MSGKLLSDKGSRAYGLGIMLGVWLSGVMAASIAGRVVAHGAYYNAAMTAALLWPAAIFISKGGFLPHGLIRGQAFTIILYLVFSFFSVFISPVPVTSMLYFMLTSVVIFIVLHFNSRIDDQNLQTGLQFFAIIGLGLIFAFAAYDYTPDVRLGEGKNILNPNALALLSAAVVCAALAFNKWLIVIPIIGLASAVIFATDSRASAVTCIIAIGISMYIRRQLLGVWGKVAAIFAVVLVVAASVYYSSTIVSHLENFFRWSDSYRGVGTGFSGRTIVWQEAWQLFLDNPVIGVGYRAQEYFLEKDSSAHNGYLGMLAEIGLIGSCAALYFIIVGIRALVGITKQPRRKFIQSLFLGLSVGYLVLAFFERYLINVGNPLSIMFLMAVLRPRRVEEAVVSPARAAENLELQDRRILRRKGAIPSRAGSV